jgi:hypothetical protein
MAVKLELNFREENLCLAGERQRLEYGGTKGKL